MDIADRAQELEEAHLLTALARHRDGRRQTPRNGSRLCFGCGEEIPEARLRALPGACLCFECQEDTERSMGR